MDTDLKLGKFHIPTNPAAYKIDMIYASTMGLSLDLFESGLHTCTAVVRITLALAKLSCIPPWPF